MEKAKTVIIETMQTNNYLITKALEGLSDDHFFSRPNETTNPIQFLLGHLTHYRYQVCQLLGDDLVYPFADLYAMGKQVQDNSTYPSADEIKAEWEKVSKSLQSLLEKADDSSLAKETPKKNPIGEQNAMGTLQFLMFHEAYHLGQISIVRRYFGYEGTIG